MFVWFKRKKKWKLTLILWTPFVFSDVVFSFSSSDCFIVLFSFSLILILLHCIWIFFLRYFFPKRFNSSEKKVKTITERKHTFWVSVFVERFSCVSMYLIHSIQFNKALLLWFTFSVSLLLYYVAPYSSSIAGAGWLNEWMNECDDTMLLNFPNKFLFLSHWNGWMFFRYVM